MSVKELHREAMRYNDLALIAKKSEPEKVQEYYSMAFQMEKKAAYLFIEQSNEEPTRSILLRSAANLGFLSNQLREAEKLVALGLSGEPNLELADELRNVLQQINFHRHLELQGLELDSTEVQLSLSGNQVGHGIVRSHEFLSRIEIIEKLAYRTADRLRNKPFKEKGRIKKMNKVEFEPFLSVPRAASFAVTIKFGKSINQMKLEGFDNQSVLIDEMLNVIELLNEGNYDKINEVFEDDAYKRNFVALAKKLAPDGDRIDLVGFTVNRNNTIRTVPLTKIKSELFTIDEPLKKEEKGKTIIISGRLDFAASKKNTIKVTDENGNSTTIIVPGGLMSDIVKPYWDEFVTVKGIKKGKKITLQEIE